MDLRARVDEALDDFERVSQHLEYLQLTSAMRSLVNLSLDAVCRIIAACGRQHKLKENKQRLKRAQPLHHLFSAKCDAVAAAERESQ